MRSNDLGTSEEDERIDNDRIRDHHIQMKVTKMLLLVSSVFLLLNLPSHAFRIFSFFLIVTGKNHQWTPVQVRGQEMCQFLYYITFSINIFLYSSGKSFRKHLKWYMHKCRNKKLNCCHNDDNESFEVVYHARR